MAVADDLDRATDSKWDWVAEQTQAYLASGGTEGHESNGVYMLLTPQDSCTLPGAAGPANPSEKG